MTKYESQTLWIYGAVFASIVCFTIFAMSMLSVSLADVSDLTSIMKIMAWRLVSGLVGVKLAGFAFWLYNKRERDFYRY